MSEFIEFLSSSAVAEMEKANKQLLEMVSNVDKVNQKIKGFTLPSQSDRAIKELNDAYQKQEKLIVSLQQKLQKASVQNEKSIERQRLAEIKLSQDREKAFDKYEKQLQREQQRLATAESLYSKVQAKLNSLSVEYKELATRKELGLSLTAKEEQRYNSLQTRIQNYDNTLKAVDATMGKHQRNVGNYAGSFNPLTNSIVQLSREMPAFANSVQTGFMAISNNLPIFFDAMQNVITQNKELQAQGKPTQSVLSQLAGSLFSFQTLLGVGVTLLTVYGKEITNWVASLWGASEALDELNKNQKEFNKSRVQGKKDAQDDIIELRKYLAVAKDTTANDDLRREAVKKIRQQYYYYFKDLTDAQILTGKYGNSVKDLTKALERKGQIELATSLNVNNKQRLIQLQEELNKENEIYAVNKKRLDNITKNAKTSLIRPEAIASVSNDLARSEKRRSEILRDISTFEKTIINNDKIIFDLKTKTIGLEIQEEQIRKRILKIKREEAQVLGDKLQSQQVNSLLNTLEEQKKKLEEQQRVQSKNNIEWRLYQKLIDGVDKSIKQLTDTQDYLGESGKKAAKELQDLGDKMKREEEALRKLQSATDEYIKSITSGFLQNAGLGSLNFFTQVKENGLTMYQELMSGANTFSEKFAITFKGITDVAKEAFDFINQSSEMSFNAQIDRLSKQKEIALTYAGDSATAREEIERSYEERRKQIERQRAEQQKKQSMFNIIINTAQGIASAVAQSPLTGGMPFAAIVAAIGAAQLAMVASQEIPAYAEGTDYHKGGLMLVNDGKGSNYQETVITPDGKKIQPKGRNVLMNAPKGTQVLTAQETLLFNQELNNMLIGNGITPNITIDNGMKAEELDAIMGKYFSNIQVNQTTVDKNGIEEYFVKKGQKTKSLDAIVSFKGFSV